VRLNGKLLKISIPAYSICTWQYLRIPGVNLLLTITAVYTKKRRFPYPIKNITRVERCTAVGTHIFYKCILGDFFSPHLP
jgi:hypothetical protein